MSMSTSHRYVTTVTWTGNTGTGTSGYRDYERAHEISADGKPVISGSSDPAFRGDPGCWNPEELLVASLSQCHMLWFLHLCSAEGIVVTEYRDHAEGTMAETPDGGHFEEVVLHPAARFVSSQYEQRIEELHERAHQSCFIASSVNFPVHCRPARRYP